MNYASIVPLIGGETLAMQNVFGKRPDYIMTYDGFQDNETHLLNYYNHEVPYYNLSENKKPSTYVDVINTVCPCAGLSSLSPSASSTNEANDWMITSAKYVLGELKPKVFWGENAPRLASKMGEPIVKKLKAIAKQNGYTFSIFKTKSILHGLSQVRDRVFYFFWNDNIIPLFEYIDIGHEKIEDTIRSVKRDPNDPMSQILTNDRRPTENAFYRYVLEEIEGGITHQEFAQKIKKTTNPLDYIESHSIRYDKVAIWMKENNFEKEAAKCIRMHEKLMAGGNIMRKNTEIPKDYIGAFVGHLPTSLTHPDEDRYLTIREAMSIMKLPSDFQLLNPKRNLNHICQNVPVTTAEDMAKNIKRYLDKNTDYVFTDFLIQDNKSKSLIYDQPSLDDFFA